MGASGRAKLARPTPAHGHQLKSAAPGETVGSPLGFVFSGGGARAAYQTGVLSYICENLPSLPIPVVTGVSAGAINAAFLAAAEGPLDEAARALKRRWCSLTTEQVFRADPASLGSIGARWAYRLVSGGARRGPEARGLLDTAPLRRFLEDSLDFSGIERNIRSGRLSAGAVSATSYATGRTVTFVQGSSETLPWERPNRLAREAQLSVDHVMASAALPILFPAIRLSGEYFGDGSIRQRAPLAPAVHLGATRLLAISTRYPRTAAEASVMETDRYPPPARVAGLLLNSIFLDTLDDDAARLERINDLLERIPDDASQPPGLRHVDLCVIRPSKDLGRLAAEYRDQLPRFVRFLLDGLGASWTDSPDFVSYLMFESAYISRLIELGERDAEADWARIEPFLRTR